MGSCRPTSARFRAEIQRLEGRVTEPSPRKVQLGDAALDARWHRKSSTSPCPPAPKITAAFIPSRRCWTKCVAIFAELGFGVAEGPDVEFDDYNFTS
jgi:phenylalanyl-tRNA synthetase alpha chain